MSLIIKNLCVSLALLTVLGLLVYDSRSHFNKGLVQVKRQHSSPQRNWNIFYGQRFVYYDSAVRYGNDLQAIEELVQPGSVVLSDLATSYYASAHLPVYARNVHRHQGRSSSVAWRSVLNSQLFCEMNRKESFAELIKFVTSESINNRKTGLPEFKYVLINNDENNKNVRLDCLWQRRVALEENIDKISNKVFEGEYLVLYELKENLPSAATDGY